MVLEIGSKAPDFTLDGSDGKKHSLKEFSGKYLVLYFYPKDDTPGCTMEAKGFNKELDSIRSAGAEVVGVSSDNYESHCKFRDKYGLEFLLLSDPGHKMIEKYDSYGDKGIFGMGTFRKTYVIDRKGMIAKIYPKVNPVGHEKDIIDFIKSVG